jgi:hypothetical protein
LVEQASAAAEALTEQAGALTQLIARYNVGGEHAAAVETPARAAAPAFDKRRADRPWSGRTKAIASASAPARNTPLEADPVWKEF